jgi:predicted TIM-barrel fold metal-dependent hydrolase
MQKEGVVNPGKGRYSTNTGNLNTMKIIDFHLHVGTQNHWTPWVIDYFRQVNPFYYEHFSKEISPDGVVAYVQSQGVEKAVVLSEYAPKTSGVVTNEFTSAFCRNHPELIPFGSVCLYEGGPLEEQAERAAKELGVRGLKMLPTYAHFYPNDERLFPLYDVAQSLGLPLLFHTGTSIFRGSRIKYGDPLFLDDVADEFPSLKIILEHGGRSLWWDRAAWLITRHRNVYVGIAGIPAKRLPVFFPQIEQYRDRFIFGSDWPGVPDIRPLVERLMALPLETETKERILGGNAREMLGL